MSGLNSQNVQPGNAPTTPSAQPVQPDNAQYGWMLQAVKEGVQAGMQVVQPAIPVAPTPPTPDPITTLETEIQTLQSKMPYKSLEEAVAAAGNNQAAAQLAAANFMNHQMQMSSLNNQLSSLQRKQLNDLTLRVKAGEQLGNILAQAGDRYTPLAQGDKLKAFQAYLDSRQISHEMRLNPTVLSVIAGDYLYQQSLTPTPSAPSLATSQGGIPPQANTGDKRVLTEAEVSAANFLGIKDPNALLSVAPVVLGPKANLTIAKKWGMEP